MIWSNSSCENGIPSEPSSPSISKRSASSALVMPTPLELSRREASSTPKCIRASSQHLSSAARFLAFQSHSLELPTFPTLFQASDRSWALPLCRFPYRRQSNACNHSPEPISIWHLISLQETANR